MRLSGRLLLAFFPDRRLRGTPWAEAWRGRERRTVRMLSRVALVATPVTYVLHHFFVDRALGLDSSPRWIIARFGGAAFGLLLFGATFWPAGGTSRWFRLPLIIAGISASLLQVLTMTWYAGVPYHYAVIIPFLVSILLQVSAPLSGLYMALVYAVEWPLLVASGARMPFVVSAMAVATIVAVSLRARMSADVDAFIVQRRLDALNAELEQRVREQVREQVA